MQLTVALDGRYWLTPQGAVFSQVGLARRFWERYLEVFSEVAIIARAIRVDRAPEGLLPVTGGGVRFHPVPDYHGPWEYLRRLRPIQAAIQAATPSRGAVILRVGSQVANCLESRLRAARRPFALEVLGDPYDVFAPGVVDHPLRAFFRWHFSRRLKRQCLAACGVAYVTRNALQQRYPSRNLAAGVSDVDLPEEALVGGPLSTHYSSIELDDSSLARKIRRPREEGPYRIVMVGSLAQMYKGADVLIRAAAKCIHRGLDLQIVVVGDGIYRAALISQARSLGIGPRVEFPGQVTAGQPVRDILDSADLFVMPSRTEGLPRALIEAMARALPCLGSSVGGIPELLEKEDLVPPGDADVLSERIEQVLRNPCRLAEMSRRNLRTSLDYRDHVLSGRRRKFYEYVRDYTRNWEQHYSAVSV